MRLINTSSLDIVDFSAGRRIPQYAILSHRWDEIELSLQDMNRKDRDLLPGFAKIQGCCNQARLDGLEWVWIDSCCIDKSSSAELSEAINSMFQWYKSSRVCYTYLADVSGGVSDIQASGHQFLASQWFTRGWTLQELLAPKYLMFFDSTWTFIGARNDWQANDPNVKLGKLIEQATGIKNLADYNNASVACKMSWAAGRSTTREEDRAYSLMGLFGVNMPPLYGEGPRAFHRLQLEILRETDDESIFAWVDPQDLSGGLLAPSVTAFKGSGGVQRVEHPLIRGGEQRSHSYARPPYSMTNKGIHFPGRALKRFDGSEEAYWGTDDYPSASVPIHCTDTTLGHGRLMCLRLGRVNSATKQWVRIASNSLLSLSEREQVGLLDGHLHDWESFYVRQLGRYESPFQGPFKIMLHIRELIAHGYGYRDYSIHESFFMQDRYKLTQVKGAIRFDIESLLMSGLTGAVMFSNKDNQHFFLVFNAKDFQISIGLLGPFTDGQKTLPGESGRNWAIFDDYFSQPTWRTRSREAFLTFESECTVSAYLRRIWVEGEQGYRIDFKVIST
ncbi:heterokaryon incompatibility protein-domain-containing protein [Cadophora sp. MPI-SDFR-AT-0126]|nr:heterokaryon incompatibility protein-domain-containing protein [Leotiomycetes sp. MPI-SDFR-AT-0126]